MKNLYDYLGLVAFGVKGGVVLPGDDIVEFVIETLNRCIKDNLISDGDVICVTESVVARSQNNFVSVDEIAETLKKTLNLKKGSRLGVLFPIMSRNRFSLILKGISRATEKGEVVLQLSFPSDEVGNRIISEETLYHLGLGLDAYIKKEELKSVSLSHPITGVDYLEYYERIIKEEGALPDIYLCNNPYQILSYPLEALIVSTIHKRFEDKAKFINEFPNVITLQEVFNNPDSPSWSEWGLLGSNLSAGEKIKLAPREASKVAERIQEKIKEKWGLSVEIIIYGDGAYKDPVTGIYELADPQPAFGLTKGLLNRWRLGVKYKYLADSLLSEGKSREEIGKFITERRDILKCTPSNAHEELGTTPRRAEDLIASLADLVSGSADAATPVVVVKGF